MNSIFSGFDSETNKYGGEIRVELVLTDAQKYYGYIEAKKNDVGKELGFPLTWSTQEGTKSHKIYVKKNVETIGRINTNG